MTQPGSLTITAYNIDCEVIIYINGNIFYTTTLLLFILYIYIYIYIYI